MEIYHAPHAQFSLLSREQDGDALGGGSFLLMLLISNNRLSHMLSFDGVCPSNALQLAYMKGEQSNVRGSRKLCKHDYLPILIDVPYEL